MDIQKRLDEIIATSGAKAWARIAQKDEAFVEAVNACCSDDIPFVEKVLVALRGSPKCKNGRNKKYRSINSDWAFCGKAGQCPCAAESVSNKSKTNIDHNARLAKTRATLEQRYGTNNPGQTPSARAAHQQFYSDPDKVESAIKKGQRTMMDRYGVDNAFKLDIDREAIARRNWSQLAIDVMDNPVLLENFLKTRSIETAAIQLGVNPTTINRYINRYDIRTELGSSYENEIAHFLKENEIEFISRSRSIIPPREVDFFIPEHNLAIEFNGLYFHSCQVVEDNNHHEKMKMAQEAGVRLIMINEDEWLERQDILKRKILILCGKGIRGDGARKLKCRKIDNAAAKSFCEKYHIQGAPSAVTHSYGAYDREENLVAVITLGKQRGTEIIELSRYCTDGKLYSGVFTKLLKLITTEIKETIVSFADLRYSDGGIYRRSGFREDGVIRPDYRYVKRLKTYHKSNFTKAKISEKFGLDMSCMTERDAMKSLGYSRIYDCGKIRFVLDTMP